LDSGQQISTIQLISGRENAYAGADEFTNAEADANYNVNVDEDVNAIDEGDAEANYNANVDEDMHAIGDGEPEENENANVDEDMHAIGEGDAEANYHVNVDEDVNAVGDGRRGNAAGGHVRWTAATANKEVADRDGAATANKEVAEGNGAATANKKVTDRDKGSEGTTVNELFLPPSPPSPAKLRLTLRPLSVPPKWQQT
jgi:hypothetical protein